jgi:hypothetical protein
MSDVAESALRRNTFQTDTFVTSGSIQVCDDSFPLEPAPTTIAFMRRRLLGRRITLEEHWRNLFPQHDFATLRLIRRPLTWDAAWASAARAYHQDRKRGLR